ncbi:MAG: ABC transporter permease, partial [Acetobacteraceae bacterium]|nr:ABC transporter permease [Acetobacteraceae bacterium]
MSAIAFFGTLAVGLLLSLVAMAVYISFRVLDFPDLTVDGSFAFGAAVAARLISTAAPPFNDPYLATAAAAGAGVLAGLVTGFLHVRLRIMHLLAGFLVMVALYSVNLRVMGRPNLPLFDSRTLVSDIEAIGVSPMLMRPLLFLVLALLAKLLLDRFMRTEVGLALRATGENPVMARANGVRTGAMTIAGIALSNGIVGLTGALFAQTQGVADVSMGVGTIIAGLAS